MQEIGVKPEMEAFEMGHLWFANQLYKEGLVDDPPWYQICLGIPWGSPATTSAMKAMADMVPTGRNVGWIWHWQNADVYGCSSCHIGRKC